MRPLALLALLALSAPACAQMSCEHYLATHPDFINDPVAMQCLGAVISAPRESLMEPRPRAEDRRLRPDLPLYLPGDEVPALPRQRPRYRP